MSASLEIRWNQYIDWMLTPEHLRGPVTTDSAWAASNGVADRTLRRWKTLPEFQALLDRRQAAMEARIDVASVTSGSEAAGDVDGDEADYRVVKSVLVEGAKSGNPKSLELYLKTYGKPFVEEEAASRTADLASLDLEDLVSRALEALAPEALVQRLRDSGWIVERAGDGDSSARA